MNANNPERYIYIVGEQQEGLIAEQAEIFPFVREQMQQIQTEELTLVLANVFARGQLFPGPDGALSAVVHAWLDRHQQETREDSALPDHRCTLITAFKRLDNEISVRLAAVMAVAPATLSIEQPQGFHDLLIDRLPGFQDAFTQEAYAPDSKLVAIIKEATLHHIHQTIQ